MCYFSSKYIMMHDPYNVKCTWHMPCTSTVLPYVMFKFDIVPQHAASTCRCWHCCQAPPLNFVVHHGHGMHVQVHILGFASVAAKVIEKKVACLCEARNFRSGRVRKCLGITYFAVFSILKNKGSDGLLRVMSDQGQSIAQAGSHRHVSAARPEFLDFLVNRVTCGQFFFLGGGGYLSFPHHCHCTYNSGSFRALQTLF